MNWRKGLAGGTLTRRVERKRATPRAPRPSAGMRAPETPQQPEEEPKTASQIVQDMAKARGQA